MGGRWLNRNKNWIKEESSKVVPDIEDNCAYGVPFIPLRCPKCKSKNVKCYSSHPPIRYHRCRECGCRFKSVEE